jgi:hypothetical protein
MSSSIAALMTGLVKAGAFLQVVKLLGAHAGPSSRRLHAADPRRRRPLQPPPQHRRISDTAAYILRPYSLRPNTSGCPHATTLIVPAHRGRCCGVGGL